jgi:hypothetical protein
MKELTFEQKKMKRFIGKRFIGSSVTINKHHERCLIVATVIYKRFGMHVYQYKQKHLLWFVEYYLNGYAKSTRYNYYLTIVKLINFSDKYIKWELSLESHYKSIEKKRRANELIRNETLISN